MHIRLALLVLIAALLFASATWAQTTTTSLAGFGDSEERPVGAWRFPEGVTLDKVEGYSDLTWEDCAGPDDDEPEPPQGAGALVQLCLTLRHTGQGALALMPIRIEIPPGVTSISDSESTQNGILIKRVTKVIQPGQTLYLPVFMMCLNVSRSGSYPGARYQIGPQLINPAFDALFARLEGKALSSEAVAQVQGAVWDLAKSRPIDPATNAYIDALPDE